MVASPNHLELAPESSDSSGSRESGKFGKFGEFGEFGEFGSVCRGESAALIVRRSSRLAGDL